MVPLVGLTDSQVPPDASDFETAKLNASPELVTLTVWPAGAAPPSVYENESALGFAKIAGPAADTLRTRLLPESAI